MTSFDFSQQPRLHHFPGRFVFAGPPDIAFKSKETQSILRNIAVAKALAIARKYPDDTIGCRLAFPDNALWVIPVNGGMSRANVFIMEKLVLCSETIHQMAKAFKKTGKVNPEIKTFQNALDKIAEDDPQQVADFREAMAENNRAEIEIGFTFLKFLALGGMKLFYDVTASQIPIVASRNNFGPGRKKFPDTSPPL